MTYADGLAARFRLGDCSLPLLALAHAGGFAGWLPEWLDLAGQARRDLNVVTLHRRFEIVLGRNVDAIERELLAVPAEGQRGHIRTAAGLSVEQLQILRALALLGDGDILVSLHARALDRLNGATGSVLTGPAALALAKAGDWSHVLAILEPARTCVAIPCSGSDVDWLWELAYGARDVAPVMPVLADVPFQAPQCLDADPSVCLKRNAWMFKSYQIRAGVPGVEVAVINDHADYRYLRALVMQIAALEDDPAAAGRVSELRAVLPAHPIRMVIADHGNGSHNRLAWHGAVAGAFRDPGPAQGPRPYRAVRANAPGQRRL